MNTTSIGIGDGVVVNCQCIIGWQHRTTYQFDLLLDGDPVMAGLAFKGEPIDFWFCFEDDYTISECNLDSIVPYISRFVEVARKFRSDHP